MIACPLPPFFPIDSVMNSCPTWTKPVGGPWTASRILAARESGKCGFQIFSLCINRIDLGRLTQMLSQLELLYLPHISDPMKLPSSSLAWWFWLDSVFPWSCPYPLPGSFSLHSARWNREKSSLFRDDISKLLSTLRALPDLSSQLVSQLQLYNYFKKC